MTTKISIDDLYSYAGSFDEEAVFTKENEVQFAVAPQRSAG